MCETRPIDTSPASKFSELLFVRQKHSNSILLVESQTDSQLFKKLLDCHLCNIRPIGNKVEVLEVMRIVKQKHEPGILAIVDADFEHIEGYEFNSDDVLRTETHDIEGIM
ncbi:MAG: DUF4435 domain-containing protein, partial [Candidatus Heimdallarchaeaceae archaeon]